LQDRLGRAAEQGWIGKTDTRQKFLAMPLQKNKPKNKYKPTGPSSAVKTDYKSAHYCSQLGSQYSTKWLQ